MNTTDILVLGAGPTGLGAAWRLSELGHDDWQLVESAAGPGGSAASVRDEQGFLWDLGGHVICSHFPAFDTLIQKAVTDWTQVRRNGWVHMDCGFVPTPVQQHLDRLGMQAVTVPASAAPPTSLGEWFLDQFGEELNRRFFAPFNTKMWAHPPAMLTHEWTSLRSGSGARNVPELRLDDRTAPEPTDTSWFPYPTHGTGSMWDGVVERLPSERLTFNRRLTALSLDRREATFDDGTTTRFEQCVSSVPLNRLLAMVTDRPCLSAQAPRLLHSSTAVLGFGFEGPVPEALEGRTWVYSPDPRVPFHRVTVLSNYSPLVAGPGRWSVLCEVGVSEHRRVDRATLVEDSLAALAEWGVTAPPVSTWSTYLDMGYPLPFHGRDALLEDVQGALLEAGVRSRGRFGGWRYESSNQDYAFMQGVEAVDAIRFGLPEDVYWHPERF